MRDRDRHLIERARRGERAALGELFDRHFAAAWRLAYGITHRRAMADDIAQDAFERAFAALSRFDAERPFAPWLHRIVVNRSLDLLRSERRLVGLDSGPGAAEPDDPGAGDRALLEAIAGLPPQRRTVLLLRYGLAYTPAQIAELLELPEGTVHSRLGRALEQLRAVRSGDAERS